MSQSAHSNQAVDRGEPPVETYEARLMRDDARRIAADLRAKRAILATPTHGMDAEVSNDMPRAAELLEAFAASLDERLKRPDLGHFEPTVAVYCAECSREIDDADDEADQ